MIDHELSDNVVMYKNYSRFTDPRADKAFFDVLPKDIPSLAKIVTNLVVHHNLLTYHGVSYDERQKMTRLKSPSVSKMLTLLKKSEIPNLIQPRGVKQRLIGACIYESHLLSSLMRTSGYATRHRAGYFKDIREYKQHIVEFWNANMKGRKFNWEQYEENPDEWLKSLENFSRRQNEINHYIEHWVIDYYDPETSEWKILDANTTFLKAHSNLDVGIFLPRKHFEYAYEAWMKLRSSSNFNPDQYAEHPQDGRSHIRASLLWDFYSLLNHDVAGMDSEFEEDYKFVKKRSYDDLTSMELDELDRLADLMSGNWEVVDLVKFYNNSKTLKLQGIIHDSYCFVNN